MRALAALLLAAPLAAQEVAFERDVLPVLEARCFRCHQGEDARGRVRRPKGALRLDGRDWILQGGDGGVVLVPGDAALSTLYTRTVLPEDHDDRMPGKGDPLTAEQTEALRRWIDAGADFGAWIGRAEPGDTTAPLPRGVALLQQLAQDLGAPAASAVARAAGEVAQITPALPEGPLLRVAFRGHEGEVDDAAVRALTPLRQHVSHLQLGGTKITDRALKTIAGMPRLVHLELQGTSVTARGVAALARLPQLRVLNLYGTAVDDAIVDALASIGTLEHVHLWQTAVTEAGAARLEDALPGARVHHALELPNPSAAPTTAPQRRRR